MKKVDISSVLSSLGYPTPPGAPSTVFITPPRRAGILRRGGVSVLSHCNISKGTVQAARKMGRLIWRDLHLPIISLSSNGAGLEAALGAVAARGKAIIVKAWLDPPFLFQHASRISSGCVVVAPHDRRCETGRIRLLYKSRDALMVALSKALIIAEIKAYTTQLGIVELFMQTGRPVVALQPPDDADDAWEALRFLMARACRYRTPFVVASDPLGTVHTLMKLLSLTADRAG